MRARLLCLTLCLVAGLADELRWDSLSTSWARAPEPRSFASLTGFSSGSSVYLYGGFSHARNAWLRDVWSQQFKNASWGHFPIEDGDLPGPLEHATLVALGDTLLLAGGRHGNGSFSNTLYKLDNSTFPAKWAVAQGGMPQLYWHSAVSYMVEGSPRVLLCGGLDGSNATVGPVYELSYVNKTEAYVMTPIATLPRPVFGHSLAVGADLLVYLSGGLHNLTDRGDELPVGAVPPRLGATMAGAEDTGFTPSDHVYLFNRSASVNSTWSDLGSVMGHATAFHSSWMQGSALFVHGGAQAPAGSGVLAPYGLQVMSGNKMSYDLDAVQKAAAQWGDVQPTQLSGAAVWAVWADSTELSVWLFGGWATPQPLSLAADTYLAPQDSSLTWRLGFGAAPSRWLAPQQGGMAPRSGGGVTVVAVTVGGSRKLLSVGGRALGGWTGASPSGGGSRFTLEDGGLPMPPKASPRVAAESYQLYDIWLIDQATGAREAVWLSNSTTLAASAACGAGSGGGSGGCSSLPFGTSASPVSWGPLWDRRLVEYLPVSGSSGGGGGGSSGGGSSQGGGNQVVYMQAAEVHESSGAALQVGIWVLTLTAQQLTAADVNFTAYTATWQSVLPPTPSPACYPRTLTTATHLTAAAAGSGTNSTLSYIAVFGGLALKVVTKDSLAALPQASVCLLELAANGSRWLTPPQYAPSGTPQARYRHACAARPGLASFSMTCYGGISGDGKEALADAWTFSWPAGISSGLSTHLGSWKLAPANYSAVRPGARVDHLMLPMRGYNAPDADSTPAAASKSVAPLPVSDYSPVILVGGALSTAAAEAARRDVWLLEASGCVDPDMGDPVATASGPTMPQQAAQVWLSVLPKATPMSAAEDDWAVVAGGVVRNETSLELWLVVANPDLPVDELNAVRVVSPLKAGCLSTSIRPYCSNLSYAYDAVASACWPGAAVVPSLEVKHADSRPLPGDSLTRSVGFALYDPNGVGLHFKSSSLPNGASYYIYDVRLPPALNKSDLTIVSYGKPYVEIARSTGSSPNMSFNAIDLAVTILSASNKSLSNITTELRVLYNGLYRKRSCSGMAELGNDCDVAVSNSLGKVSFTVFPVNQSQPVAVSYALIVLSPTLDGTTYAAELPSHVGAAAGGPSTIIGTGGISATLLSDRLGLAYAITLPAAASDSKVDVTFNITFWPPPGVQLRLPANRRWCATFNRYIGPNSLDSKSTVTLNESYSARKISQRMESGVYSYEMLDSNPLFSLTTGDALVSEQAVVPIDVYMSSITFRVVFSRLVWPSSLEPNPKATRMMVRLGIAPSAVPEGPLMLPAAAGLGISSEMYWDELMIADDGQATFTVIPNTRYVVLYRPSGLSTVLAQEYVTSAPFTVAGLGGNDTFVKKLPQALLCGPETTTYIQQQKGKFPADDVNPGDVVYALGTNCMWIISTGMPIMLLRLNYTGLGPNDYITLLTDTGFAMKLSDQDGVFAMRMTASNVTIRFRTGSDNSMSVHFTVEWEGQAQSTSMPPQFIMMIAASSAAAGAMLLFLCLWHCVFRPVQMRRQQAAAALAAAANAGASGVRSGASRTRVPRRYLRMMETTSYSSKDTLAKAPVPKVVVVEAAAPKSARTGLSEGPTTTPLPVEMTTMTPKAEPPPPAAAAAGTAVAVGDVMADAAEPPSGPASQSEPEAAGGEVCSICLSEFEDGERVKHLPCKHFYHVACIDQWLGRDITCPLCKDNVLDAMRALFGPLPPRSALRPGGRATGVGEEEDGANAAAAAAAGAASPRLAPGAAAADGTGAGATTADLEMVVILPHPPEVSAANAAAAGGGSGGEAGDGRHDPGLPGSTGPWETAAGGQVVSGGMGVTPPNAGPGPPTAAHGASGGGGVTAVPVSPALLATGAAAGGAGADVRTASTAQSRELRPMRRNISTDLTTEHYGTSTDSDSDSEFDAAAAAAANNTNSTHIHTVGGGPINSSRSSPPAADRAFQAVAHPTSGQGQPHQYQHQGASAAPGAGNQLVVPPLGLAAAFGSNGGGGRGSGGAAAAPSPYFETSVLTPSPRPVVEHVQRSPCSGGGGSSSALRWVGGGSSQVMPMPRPPALSHVSTQHRLPRAQEAQMAVAAAALSAAAAGVSGGGNSWRTASTTSAGDGDGVSWHHPHAGASPHPPPLDSPTAIVLNYRMHNNPLAASSPSADGGSPRAIDQSASEESHASGGGGGASGSPGVVAVMPYSPPLQGGLALLVRQNGLTNPTVSVLSSSHLMNPSRRSSASSNGGVGTLQVRAAGALAVPEVCASGDDLIRTPSAMARTAGGAGSGGGNGPAAGAHVG